MTVQHQPTTNGVAELKSVDPTNSQTLRSKYEAQYYERWRKVKGAVNTTLIENDALGLNAAVEELEDVPEPPTKQSLQGQSRQQKKQSFNEWLAAAAAAVFAVGVAEILSGLVALPAWMGVFAIAAFVKGVRFARARLREAGYQVHQQLNNGNLRSIVQTQDPYRTRLADARDDHAEALDKVIDDTLTEATREVGTGLAGRRGRREIAANINDRIEKIGITNGRRAANAEVNRTFNHGALTTYEQHGVEEVEVEAEEVTYVTANDSDVCGECAPYHNETMTIEEFWDLVPQHPYCRCAATVASL